MRTRDVEEQTCKSEVQERRENRNIRERIIDIDTGRERVTEKERARETKTVRERDEERKRVIEFKRERKRE